MSCRITRISLSIIGLLYAATAFAELPPATVEWTYTDIQTKNLQTSGVALDPTQSFIYTTGGSLSSGNKIIKNDASSGSLVGGGWPVNNANGSMGGVVTDSAGNVYNASKDRLSKYNSSGVPLWNVVLIPNVIINDGAAEVVLSNDEQIVYVTGRNTGSWYVM